MTSIREAIRSLLERREAPDDPDPEFSYVIYWTKVAREWDVDQRRRALQAAERLINQPDFQANAFARRYQVSEIDTRSHSGVSLLALRKVLRAFEDHPA